MTGTAVSFLCASCVGIVLNLKCDSTPSLNRKTIRNPLLHHTGQRLHLSGHRRSGLDRQVDEESPDDRAPRHAEAAARQRAALDIPQVRSDLDDECSCAGQKTIPQNKHHAVDSID